MKGKVRNISDIIEGYLKQSLELEGKGLIEIKRSELADKFQCVPSQINYVINTRFTVERGYVVESKRGGGGYIRIVRVEPHSKSALFEELQHHIETMVSQHAAEHIVYRLLDEGIISKREAKLMLAAIDHSTIALPLPARDEIRSRILQAMLLTLKYERDDEK